MKISKACFGFWALAILYLTPIKGTSAQLQSYVATSGVYAKNPPDPTLFGGDTQSLQRLFFRQIIKGQPIKRWRAEFNGFAFLQGSSEKGTLDRYLISNFDQINRSSELHRNWHESDALTELWAVDRLNMRGSVGRMQLALGRYPIDFSKTFIYRPNDLFAPFRPYQFDRNYKAGVDAITMSYPLGTFSTFRWINVAGYESQEPEGNQTRNKFSEKLSSSLFHYSDNIEDYYLAAFAGKHRQSSILGVSAEGEVAKSLGFHMDFHQLLPDDSRAAYVEAALSFDYRWSHKSIFQLEFYNHGAGYNDKNRYTELEEDPNRPVTHLSRRYAGGVFTHDYNPLTTIRTMIQKNLVDQSVLGTFYIKRSLGQASELTLIINNSNGESPVDSIVKTEYGSYPKMMSIEIGSYF